MNAYVASALLRIAYREHAYAIDRQGMNPGQMPVVDGYPTMRTSVAPSAQAITAKDAEAALIYDDAAFGDLAGGVVAERHISVRCVSSSLSMGYAWPAFPG